VWEDVDGDGIQDAGEPGIPNVTVNLNVPGLDGVRGTADDVFIASDLTDGNGNYLYDGLPLGVYSVDPDETTVPAGYVLTTANDPETVDLGPGEDFLDADFGYGPLIVQIDIKSGSDPNCFNNDGYGVIPVAILTTDTFDASTVDPFSASLDGMGARVKGKSGNADSLEDVDGDRDLDLVVQIEDTDGVCSEGTTNATLAGVTFDGVHIQGTDSICIVP
jgi:hypothetical protein